MIKLNKSPIKGKGNPVSQDIYNFSEPQIVLTPDILITQEEIEETNLNIEAVEQTHSMHRRYESFERKLNSQTQSPKA